LLVDPNPTPHRPPGAEWLLAVSMLSRPSITTTLSRIGSSGSSISLHTICVSVEPAGCHRAGSVPVVWKTSR
jgi:hypothetical protein